MYVFYIVAASIGLVAMGFLAGAVKEAAPALLRGLGALLVFPVRVLLALVRGGWRLGRRVFARRPRRRQVGWELPAPAPENFYSSVSSDKEEAEDLDVPTFIRRGIQIPLPREREEA